MNQQTRPNTPLLTVDIIIEMLDVNSSLIKQSCQPLIVLIERKNPPFGWALPGGFVDIGESVTQAARREAMEETSLSVKLKTLLGVYSDPARDQRGHTVSVVYIAEATDKPCAADDAAALQLVDPAGLLPKLAFDHPRIISDYLNYRDYGQLPNVE
ncbi:MAG: NUDIX hydrolase [Gammaproteobacteria bacterium]|nr:NUDIX hydrolase [Gammaproteobacteria bacterium]